MKRKDKLNDYRGQSKEALHAKIDSLQQELMNLRFRNASRQLEKTAQISSIKKDIARIHTILREAE
ncbi:MAG: 50S ribosomal protein L29 [Deltaproteobacteria bacterium]|nr:50S ribosomal protein L29 [Deltaproteobacteria bacterium]